jgi:hypothetical protein
VTKLYTEVNEYASVDDPGFVEEHGRPGATVYCQYQGQPAIIKGGTLYVRSRQYQRPNRWWDRLRSKALDS